MSRNRQWWFGAFASLPIAVLSSCASQPLPSLTASASQKLSADVANVETAARSGNTDAVRAALAALRTDVAKLQDSGGVTAARAAEIVAAANRIATDTGANVSPAPAPTVVIIDPGKVKKHDNGGGDNGSGGD